MSSFEWTRYFTKDGGCNCTYWINWSRVWTALQVTVSWCGCSSTRDWTLVSRMTGTRLRCICHASRVTWRQCVNSANWWASLSVSGWVFFSFEERTFKTKGTLVAAEPLVINTQSHTEIKVSWLLPWFFFFTYTCVARWPSGWDAGLAINRSRVRIPVSPLSSATLGKLLTYMCLCHQAV